MGKAKKTRKFAVAKKIISPKDTRVASNIVKAKAKEEEKIKKAEPRQVEQAVSALFFEYNTQLGPPYHVLVDTNFINFSIRYVLEGVACYTVTIETPYNVQSHQLTLLPNDTIKKKVGHDPCHDGLSFGQMHSMYYRLCHG